jgi:fatty-acyl-CoA synthase
LSIPAVDPALSDLSDGFWGRVASHLGNGDQRPLLVFEQGTDGRNYSGAELLARLPRLAARIAEATPDGSLVLIISDDPEMQWLTFLAAMWAGRVPGLLTPPSAKIAPERYAAEFRVIGETHTKAVFLAAGEVKHSITEVATGLTVIDLGKIFDDDTDANFVAQPTSPIRFYQQSSGTTGIRKGMIVEERQLLAQLDLYGGAVGWRKDDVVVSWLPLYHDMGLIAAAFGALLHGSRFVCTSPFQWLAKPRWLMDAFARHNGTLCWMPNFAFEFMVNRWRASWQMPNNALASARLIVNCSEVVSKASMDRFVDRFQCFGFSESAVGTCYAMAENVFAVTQSTHGGAARGETVAIVSGDDGHWAELNPAEELGRSIASSGYLLPRMRLRIDGDEAPADRKVGHIEIASPTLVESYTDGVRFWPVTKDGWYATNDLGFMSDGELFVLGRGDDMINRAGNLIDPAVIELAAETVTGIKSGRIAVFGVDQQREGTQGFVLLAEPENAETPLDEVRQVLNERVTEMTGLTPTIVRIVPPGWLLKSSSGKISRQRSREKYLNANLGKS